MYQHLQRGHLAGSPYTTYKTPLVTPLKVQVYIGVFLAYGYITVGWEGDGP